MMSIQSRKRASSSSNAPHGGDHEGGDKRPKGDHEGGDNHEGGDKRPKGDHEGGDKRPKGNAYEVFLSFRGIDTRKSFTDYLYTSLIDAGIHVFRDDNELRVGEEIGPELLCSIMQSTISIPIISKNYVSSKWCLHELVQMLKCKRSKGQIVLPIFYKVEPSQVRHPTGRLRKSINAHKKNMKEMVVKEWEEALKEVSSLKGWESEKIDNGHEGTLVKIIVKKVMGELKRLFQLNVPDQLVGIEDHVQQIMSNIDAEFNGTKIIGIYGMGGIGKTTLAKVLYNKLSSHSDYHSFLANIRETSQRNGIECVQKQLIHDITRSSYDVSNVDEGVSFIKSRFMGKKVLVLLDDIDHNTQLNALVGDSSWVEAGSIVIITTRNKSILDEANVGYMYQLNELSLDQSLILFSRHAFRKDSPPSDYEVISGDVVSTTGGLPLALEVIGSFLWRKRKDLWKGTLKKLKKVPHEKVREKLKISYDALDYREQQIFLDIACIFIGSCKQNPTYMWDACDFFPRMGIEVLSLLSLIKIDEDGKLSMHDQLRDLGREIVRLENPNEPQERSRLWNYEEALDVLDNNEGTRKIEVLLLDRWGYRKRYAAEQFKELTNLRFLQVNYANFTGDFQSLLPKLRWLQWQGCPLDFTVVNFHPKKLVVLDLSNSAISEAWGGWVPLKKATELKVLNLMSCQSLKRTPDLSTFVRLEILTLKNCHKLEELHPSIGDIKTLVSLDVYRCRKLKELPKGIGRMIELRDLNIAETNIQDIPISSDCLMKLECLSLCHCKISQLPKSMGSLVSLTQLPIYGLAIKELPESIGAMKELKAIYANRCEKLAHIPNSIGNLASLQWLELEGCYSLTEIPDSIGNLASLIKLDLRKSSIMKLPNSIGNLASLQRLELEGCCSLTEIPDSIGNLASLIKLDLRKSSIMKLPESIGNLQNLRKLYINRTHITELPDAIGMLAELQKLRAMDCKNLEQLPSNICQLISLKELCLYGCEKLRELPDQPSGLTDLSITCQGQSMPRLSQLTRLKELILYSCHRLEYVPELPIGLPDLRIINCGKLKALTNLSDLKNLRYFEIFKCPSLEGLLDVSNFRHAQMRELGLKELEDCPWGLRFRR